MQPTMTSMACARAVATMRSASRSEPHLASLMLIPSTAPATRGMSALTMQLSSTTTGRTPWRRSAARPSRSWGGSGCSTNSTPWSLSIASICIARCLVQPAFASTRIGLSVASRTVRRICSSCSVPSLILRIGYRAASRTLSRIFSGVSMPIVKKEHGALNELSPHRRHSGWPTRLPTRSCSAADNAARAAPSFGATCENLASATSRSNASPGRCGSSRFSAASTVSAVSP